MTPELEEWRDIEGWPGYRVSSWGRVRGVRGWILAALPDGGGYSSVQLFAGGERRSERVHVLVLLAFVGPRPTPEHEGEHRDRCRTNNHLYNLWWATKEQNNANRELSRGEAHPCSVLTEPLVRLIRESDKSDYAWARELGVCRNVVWKARNKLTWAHVE